MATPKSNNYKLDYLTRGAIYRETFDYRRFVTLDYNLESYVGIVGIGIIDGWEIEVGGGLTISILPGKGIISGYAVESPYDYKQRSMMISGDREVEEVHDTQEIQPFLTTAERDDYIAVVQEYDPTFSPPLLIENSFVKVVTPSTLVLPDNSEVYVFAKRLSEATPYPKASDFPISRMQKPKSINYMTYDEYLADFNIYIDQVNQIHDYHWRTNPDNHFNAVDFYTEYTYNKDDSSVLLGRILTNNGSIVKIDVSQVESLKNMESTIRSAAIEFVSKHRHGGTKYYDPPKIRLETDIRTAALKTYNGGNGATFNVLERSPTGLALGHQHKYFIDLNGNGYTVQQTDSSISSHFHQISNYIVGNQEKTQTAVEDHSHSLPNQDTSGGWTASSPFNVYINGNFVGDETSSAIEADSTEKTIKVFGLIGATYKSFTTSFVYNGNSFSYTASYSNVLQFILHAMIAYNSKYGDYIVDENGDFVSSLSPFVFEGDAPGTIQGLDQVINQSLIAQALLKKAGDTFIFTPKAAADIPVTLISVDSGAIDYNVKIEILGNTEVTGVLSPENIFYIKASNLTSGKLDIARIPFVSHIGRMGEDVLAFKYPMVSTDGIVYSIVPSITSTDLDHSHKLFLDKTNSGVTTQTFVGEDPVYYAEGLTGSSYMIDHVHGVASGSVKEASSANLLSWQNDIHSQNGNSSSHVHTMVIPIEGNPKAIYSIKEGNSGIIYAGTSSGLYAVPTTETYLYVINGYQYYLLGSDLWNLLLTGKELYEKDSGKALLVTSDIYGSQISAAYDVLLSHGDSVLLYGYLNPQLSQDLVMVKRVDYFEVPNLKYIVEKKEYEVTEDEFIVGSNSKSLIVERDFTNVPIWSIALGEDTDGNEEITVVGADVWATNTNLENSFYKEWLSPSISPLSGSLKNAFKDSHDDVWVSASNSLLAARSYQNGIVADIINQPGIVPNVNGTIEGEVDAIYCAVDKGGIYKTLNRGGSWTRVFNNIFGCSQIIRDYTKDKTTTVSSHYHTLDVNILGNGLTSISIGSGASHFHAVSSWNINTTSGHTHTLIVSLYAITNDNTIYSSFDNGNTWNYLADVIVGEHGDLFAYKTILASTKDGLFGLDETGAWVKVFDQMVYSFSYKYDMRGLLLGGYNTAYSTTDIKSFNLLFDLGGTPKSTFYLDGVENNYGYAYGSKDNSFRFKELTYNQNNSFGLVDFGRLLVKNGPWNPNSSYDIYINGKIILSTNKGIDKREADGYWFDVIPSEGVLDFSASSSLITKVSVYDNSINVENTSKFHNGDLIVIKSENVKFYGFISNISGKTIFMNIRVDVGIELPAKVYKIPNIDGQTVIKANIYESPLSDIGVFSHEEIENKLSSFSDGRPYALNNAYLSNLLQVTQAIKYIYPDIDSEFKNTKLYDFHYGQPVFPDIEEDIDIYNTEVHNFSLFTNVFYEKGAKRINKIIFGTGNFIENVFVATDIGIFWAKIENGLEGNWFYVSSINSATYDLKIYENVLFAATTNGIYTTSNMQTWNLQDQSAVKFMPTTMSLRWGDSKTVSVPAHTATFSNIVFNTSNSGSIASTGTIYEGLEANNKIEINNAGDIDGVYTIKEILNLNTIITFEPLTTDYQVTISGVTIKMGAWWEYFNGDINTNNPNIYNTLLVGGKDKIAYCPNSTDMVFSQAFIPAAVSDFQISTFGIIDNGTILAPTISNKTNNFTNHVLKTTGIGDNWEVFKSFGSVVGTLSDFAKVTNFSHTKLFVSYNEYLYTDGSECKKTISLFKKGIEKAIYTGKVIWNEYSNGDIIYVYGSELYSILTDLNLLSKESLSDISFTIDPIKINSIAETEEKSILYGTDLGLYSDENSMLGIKRYSGNFIETSMEGIVNKIDTSGKIKSISSNVENGNIIMNIVFDGNVPQGSLIDSKLYIIDLPVIEPYLITNDSGSLINGEITIEINKPMEDVFSSYVGKNITIVGKSSRIYLTFNNPVVNDQCAGGKLYIASNEFEGTFGKEYNIVSNTSNYIDIKETIVPISTLFYSYDASDLQTGQKVIAVDNTGKITLSVWFDIDIDNNSLVGMSVYTNSSDPVVQLYDMRVYSNTKNTITLLVNQLSQTDPAIPAPLIFNNGDEFYATGFVFNPVYNFNNKRTSFVQNHYHDILMIGGIISGKVESFIEQNASYVDIAVSDTNRFDLPIVQLRKDLFTNGKISFHNTQSRNIWYDTEIISFTNNSIRVRLLDVNMWNFTKYDENKVSISWDWEINASNYGYTENIYYSDFVSLYSLVTSDIGLGENIISVESTSGMNIGDKIKITDGTLKAEVNYIKDIVNSNVIQTNEKIGLAFYLKDVPSVKVLRDTFPNNHVHQIRNCQTETLYIQQYLDLGYASYHSHESLSLIPVVSKVLKRNSEIIAIGSVEKIFLSYNSGIDWKEIVDLNRSLEGGEEISGLTDVSLYNNKFIVGTDNGYIATEDKNTAVVPIEKPTVI